MALQRLSGRIHKANKDKGYAFIQTDAKQRYFFHARDHEDGDGGLQDGSIVTFTPVDNSEARVASPKVLDRAVHVRRIVA